MTRNRTSCVLAMLAILALAMPLAARTNEGKNTKSKVSATVELVKDAVIGGRQVKAGTYDVKVNDTKLTLSRDGKVVAESPIEWKDEQSKSAYSAIVVDGGAIKEVHFNGKTRYARLSESSMPATGQQ
jgi:hypothetical protein